MYINATTTNDIKKLHEIAQRIIDIDFYGARDAGETPETIYNQIIGNPADTLTFLLDTIDDLQA